MKSEPKFARAIGPRLLHQLHRRIAQGEHCTNRGITLSPDIVQAACRNSEEGAPGIVMIYAFHFYDGDFPALLDLVRSYDPVGIVTGNELGVELTANLVGSSHAKIGNVPRMAIAHRDRRRMALAVERAGAETISTDARMLSPSGFSPAGSTRER